MKNRNRRRRALTQPLTIISDRYLGSYSQGKITAWPLPPDAVPLAVKADDSTCSLFWRHARDRKWAIGLGRSAAEATLDLRRKLASGYSSPGSYLGDWLP